MLVVKGAGIECSVRGGGFGGKGGKEEEDEGCEDEVEAHSGWWVGED